MRAFVPALILVTGLSAWRTTACSPGEPTPFPTPTPAPTPEATDPPAPTPIPPPPGHGASCSNSSQCSSGEACWGQANSDGEPMSGTGCCTSTAPIPGNGSLCGQGGVCGEGLVCIGQYCSPAWMAADFTHDTPQAIPDGGLLFDPMLVHCLATVAVDVTLDLRIEHPRLSDLRITMDDVSRDIHTVVYNQQPSSSTVLELNGVFVNHSGDEYVNGDWPLTVEDLVPGAEGKLLSWTLHVTSRWD